MNMIVRRFDNKGGGFDYVEYDPTRNLYKTGSTSINEYYDAEYVDVIVKTYKDLERFEKQLILKGVEVDSRYGIEAK